MKRFVIERDLPGAEKLSTADLEAVAQKSCNVLHEMGPTIQWLESFVAKDKIYCVYVAKNAEQLHEHGKKGEFPVTLVAEVASVIGPHTAGADYVPGG